MTSIDRGRLADLTRAEQERFRRRNPRSQQLFEQARAVLPGGVPMSWMTKWPGGLPVYADSASGAHIRATTRRCAG